MDTEDKQRVETAPEQEESGAEVYNVHEKRMETMPVRKLIFENSIPLIVGIMMFSIYNTSNRFWVSRIPDVGPQALAAVSYVLPIMLLKFGFAMLVGFGSAANISISLGQRDRDRAEQVLGNVMSMSAIIGAAVIVLGLVFRQQMLNLLGVPADVRPLAEIYYTFHILSYFVAMIYYGMNHPIRAAGNQMRFAKAQVLLATLNIILDPVFIIGFGMGIAGAGVAMITSLTIAGCYIMKYYLFEDSTLKLRLKNIIPRRSVVYAISALGISSLLMQIVGSGVHIFMNSLLTRFGEIQFGYGNGSMAVAAMAIVHVVFNLAITPVIGIMQGVQPVVGFNYGAKNYSRVKAAYSWGIIYGMGVCALGGAIVLISPQTIVSIFTDNPYIEQMAVFGIRPFMAVAFVVGFNILTTNFFLAISRPKISIALNMTRQLMLLIPAYFILTSMFGFAGFWFALPFAEATAGLIGAVLVIREFRALKIKLRKIDEPASA
ncbi:MAG: MATE family efflux transporter [Defluviitaleaceae bacterium]|nr:MATE family efflux transporter [Defluviitaleaceae bacterium]